jgi:hypothetical protein
MYDRRISGPWRRKEIATHGGLPLVLFLGLALLARVLTDNLSSPDSRQSGSLNFSGVVAVLFIVLAVVLFLRSSRGVMPTALAVLWLCVWTVVAVGTRGASTETLREGIREGSVVAVAVIVYNARGALSVPRATRLVQLLGSVPAVIAIYQLFTNTGVNISGQIRSNGTFAHPNSAAMFFAICAIVSLWGYLDRGRRCTDGVFTTLFLAALISTFSIDGAITLVVMLVALGALRPGSIRVKVAPFVLAGVVVVVFFATPLGAHRISQESKTSVATIEAGGADTTLSWRIHKWKTLLPDWERSPLLGRGLGTTLTAKGEPGDKYTSRPPHNEYVRYLVETGIVGMAALLIGLWVLGRNLLQRRSTLLHLGAGTLSAPTLALVVLLGCVVNALADNTFLDSPTCYAAALIVTAVLALPRVEKLPA